MSHQALMVHGAQVSCLDRFGAIIDPACFHVVCFPLSFKPAFSYITREHRITQNSLLAEHSIILS